MFANVSKASLFWLVVICSAIVSQAQGSKPAAQKPASDQPVYFNADGREVIQSSALAADKATSIGNVLTLLFDGARLSLQNASDPLTATWTGTIRVPVNVKSQGYRSYLQHIRGAVTKDGHSSVTLIFNLGGTTFVRKYGYGMKSNGDVTLKFISPIKPRPAQSYTATLVIMVERAASTNAVLVSVDSLDVDARSGAKVKKKTNPK